MIKNTKRKKQIDFFYLYYDDVVFSLYPAIRCVPNRNFVTLLKCSKFRARHHLDMDAQLSKHLKRSTDAAFATIFSTFPRSNQDKTERSTT